MNKAIKRILFIILVVVFFILSLPLIISNIILFIFTWKWKLYDWWVIMDKVDDVFRYLLK